MAFWFDKGVDGFRVDMASSLIKNDPDKKEVSKLWNEMRAWKDKYYPETVLISEWANPQQAIPAGFNIDFYIHFGLKGYASLFFDRKTPWGRWENSYQNCYFDKLGKGSLKEFSENYTKAYNATKNLGYIAVPSANHDYQRPNIGTRNTPDQLKVAMTFFLTMPGIPFIYYGDEIGMKYQMDLPNKEGSNERSGTRTPMQWTKGVEAYTSGNWNESVESWKELESVGVVSPELYYNLGNAYYKSGDYAHAILYFERTLKIDPSNSDARYNLEFTNSMIQDKIDAVPEFVLKNWARKLSYLMSPDSWAWLSIALLALTLALVLMFLLGGTTAFRRCGFYGAIVALLLSLGTYGLALWQRNSCLKADYAVVMIPVSSVKSSPSSESSKDLFILHEGTKVQILDSVGQWKNISLSDGRQGWIKDNDIQTI